MRIPKRIYLGVASVLVAAGAFVGLMSLTSPADALTITSRADCGYTDPIINCGVQSTEKLLQMYDANSDGRSPANRDIQSIFNHYGITRSMITDTKNIKHGWLNHVDGTISVDGKVVGTNAQSLYRVKVPGKTLSSVSIKGKTYYIGKVAGQYKRGADVFVFYKNGKPYVAIQASCGNPIPFVPKEEEKPKPVYACKNLTSQEISRNRYRFTATASATNAEIVSYKFNFGDGTTQTTTNKTIEHIYEKPGKYTVTVSVNVKANGKTETVTSDNCKVEITVKEEPKEPVMKCESLTSNKISRTNYQFTATASGENGAKVVSYTFNFGDGSSPTTTNSRTTEHNYSKPGTYIVTVTANFTVNGKNESKTSPDCKVSIKVDEQPAYKCEGLTANKINRTTFGFNANASAQPGAQIVSYTFNFGDGSSQTVNSNTTTHEYAQPGDYTATVTVNFLVEGQSKTDTNNNCKVTITVEEEPVTPEYRCDLLTAKPVISKDRTYIYTLQYTTEGGADLDRVVYDFGDGSTETFTKAQASNVQHTYAQPGEYKTVTTLYFIVPENGVTVEKTDTCEVKVTVPQPEMCPIPGKEHLPKDSPDCKEDTCPIPGKEHLPKDSPDCKEDEEMCPIPGKEHLPKDSPDCKEDTCPIPGKEHLPKDSQECVELPPELPKTGMELFISGSLGIGSISAASYYWVASRRNLLNSLLDR